MIFAEPNYAYMLFLLPFIALVKIWADGRAARALKAFASSERLRTPLMGGASPVWSGIHFGLQVLGLGFFVIALTRPQIGVQHREIQQTGRNIFIAIDTSKSMLANDMAPNRLTRAKLAAQDLLEKLPGDRVGLIAFAGRAFLQAPLTTDHEAVVESIHALDQGTIPRGGSSLSAAIELSLESLEKMAGKQHGMIIFTDGQETDEGTLKAAKEAAKKNLLILPVGVGTVDGELIPDPDQQNQGDFVRDENGNVIRTRLEAGLLREVASITGGEYVELASQALTQSLVNRLLENLDRQKEDSRQETKPVERYQWPLFAGMLCLAMSLLMRPSSRKLVKQPALPVERQALLHPPMGLPGRTMAWFVIGSLLMGSTTTQAATEDAIVQAQRAYEQGRYEDSRNAYSRLLNDEKAGNPDNLAYGLGASALQLKDYERATSAFSQALRSPSKEVQTRSMRGLGTSLYNSGAERLAKEPEATVKAWTDSLQHFETASKLSPEDTELQENRDFVKKRLEALKKQQEQKKQQGKDKKKDKQKGEGKGEGDPEEGEEGQEPKDQNGEQNGDRKQKEHDAMQKEQGELPEGDLKAGEGGKPEEQKEGNAEGDQDKKNDKTRFSQQEARSQLKNYADDQKSVQYLMRREPPEGGKDY